MTIKITEGVKTALTFELPPQDGTEGVNDLSGYTGWVVKIGRPRVAVTIEEGVAGSDVTASAGSIVATPGTAAATAMAALKEGSYGVEIVGTTASVTHKWRDTLIVERGVRA